MIPNIVKRFDWSLKFLNIVIKRFDWSLKFLERYDWFFKKIPKYSHKNALSYAAYVTVCSTTFNLDRIHHNNSRRERRGY